MAIALRTKSSSSAISARRLPRKSLQVECISSFFNTPFVGKTASQVKIDSKRVHQTYSASTAVLDRVVTEPTPKAGSGKVQFQGVHHVALICSDLEKSLDFYVKILGLTVNPDRPHSKLPYRGAWLWIGPEMIHLMELPNPDPLDNRPEHGGRDRHFCVGVKDIEPLVGKLEKAGLPYTKSMSGRPAIFFRDPDANTLECVEGEAWR